MKSIGKQILLGLVILFAFACEKEQPLTPDLSAGSLVTGTPITGGTGGTSGQYTTERYITATIDGESKSLVRTGNILNFTEPQFSRGYSMSCSGECFGNTTSGLTSGVTRIEIEFYQTYLSSPQTEQEIFDRINVGSHSYKLSDQSGNVTAAVDSVVILYTDANNKVWTSNGSSSSAVSQAGSYFSVSEMISITRTSGLTFDYEKDNFIDSLPATIIRGQFNCNLYDDSNNRIILKDGEFSLRFDADQ